MKYTFITDGKGEFMRPTLFQGCSHTYIAWTYKNYILDIVYIKYQILPITNNYSDEQTN